MTLLGMGACRTDGQQVRDARKEKDATGTRTVTTFDPEAALTKDEKELRDKIRRLVEDRFDRDYRKAFDHYDGNDGALDRSELLAVLKDAKVGNRFTRGAWASGLLEKLDEKQGNRDGKIQWPELAPVLPEE
jgi:Ca2+-binding EF-hand superfamily protein